MGDIGSIIIIVIVFRVIFLLLSAWWRGDSNVTDSSLAKSHTTLLRCRQATRTVAVRG